MEKKKVKYFQSALQQIRIEIVGGVEKLQNNGKNDEAEHMPDISDDAARAYERKLQADWEVGREEAQVLFEINDTLHQGEDNTEGWAEFFVDAIAQFIVFDMNSPGEIDQEEARWLIDQLVQHPILDQNEEALLKSIKKQATRIDDKLIEFLEDPRP